MHSKENGHRFGVLFVYTITVISLRAGGWCETLPAKTHSQPAPHHVRNQAVTRNSLSVRSRRDGAGEQRLGPRPAGGEGPPFPVSHHLRNGDGSQTKRSGGEGPEQRPRTGMALPSSDQLFKTLRSSKEEAWMSSSLGPADEDCGRGRIQRVVHGTFNLTGKLEATVPREESQPDPGPSGQAETIWAQQARSSEESRQRLQPVVECGDDAMTLTVRRRRAVQLRLDRVNESSVPLSQLPPQCGYSVWTTFTDLSLRVQYNGCHVTHEDDRYVLRLLWRWIPVKVSCPVEQLQPQDTALCCSLSGMTIRVQGPSAAEELRVKVRGQWTPLMELAEQCGYTLDRRQVESVISVPFITCDLTVQDGKLTLPLQIGEATFTLSCPMAPSHEELLQMPELLDSSHYRTRELREALLGSSDHFPWAPPFYLAPLYYPHPTNHHRYPRLYEHDAYNPPTPTSSTPAPAFDPQSHVDSRDSPHILARWSNKHFSPHSSLLATNEMDLSRAYSDLQQIEETPVPESSRATASSVLTEAPSLQPPSHTFNAYYHYYHHPKIPLPAPPQNPSPGPEVGRELLSANPHNEIPVLPVCDQESDVESDLFPHPVFWTPYVFPTSPKLVHKATESRALYFPYPYPPYLPPPHPSYLLPPHPYPPSPPQPYPHQCCYFPYISSEAKVSPLYPDMATETNVSAVPSFPLKYVMNPFIDRLNEMRSNKPSLFSEEDVKPDDVKGLSAPVTPLLPKYPPKRHPVSVPPSRQPDPTLTSNHHPPPYPFYFYPDFLYSNGPGILHSAEQPLSRAPTKPLDKPPTSAPVTTSLFDVPNPLLNPYYHYYHRYYQPDQDLHPGPMDSRAAGSLLQSGSHNPDQLAHADEAEYAGLTQPLHGPFHSFYPHHVPPHRPFDLSGHQSGEKDPHKVEGNIQPPPAEDRLEANAPSAPPCVLGPVSDSDCSNSLGCCLYYVRDCTVGQHFVLVLPSCLLEPTLTPPTHPSDGCNVSCSLKKLTSDPDVYIVPLVGCGVAKQEFGDSVVHRLEVHGTRSHQADNTSGLENIPVRLMVECISSPGSPGEVRLHVMDQSSLPPAYTAPPMVIMQLRIATDQSFASYHLDTRLPLSLLRGKPLYLEVRLLDPPEPALVLLVHSCLAYTDSPFISWMSVYDGIFSCHCFSCSSQSERQLLPSPRSDSYHIRRIAVSSFLSLPSENPSYMARRGSSLLEDPEIYFLCLTEVCFSADDDCTLSCTNGPNSKQ